LVVPLRRNKEAAGRIRTAAPALRPRQRRTMTAPLKIPIRMTVAEVPARNPPGHQAWQRVDGERRAPAIIEDDALAPKSTGFRAMLPAIYRTTRLARR
jgi:hypothetical protein